tara:strand:- start:49 stop:1068 length:1020 start_codon:yes stop_codon:yes gene_type:complete
LPLKTALSVIASGGIINMDIILSHPFSGSLYAYFTEQAENKKVPNSIGHSYYQTLYGKNHNEVRDLALTQLLMHEKVYIVPADNHMPETNKYYSGDDYVNDELGLYTSWKDHDLLRDQIEEQVQIDMTDPTIISLLKNAPHFSIKQILTDSRFEISLANKYDCPILSTGGRSKIISRLCSLDNNDLEQIESNKVIAVEEYLNIMNLTFNPTNYDLLYAYKQDSELRDYAVQFKDILNTISSSDNVRVKLLELIRESINKEKLYNKTSGALDVSATVMSLGGFIPVVGPFFSGASLLATAGGKVADKKASRTWYEFSNQINKIKTRQELDSLIAAELKNT